MIGNSEAERSYRRKVRLFAHLARQARDANPYGAKKRRSRLGVPGIAPGSQEERKDPAWWAPVKGTASDTANALAREQAEIDRHAFRKRAWERKKTEVDYA